MELAKNCYRSARIVAKQVLGLEPIVRRNVHRELEFHGSADCGWMVPSKFLTPESVVVDVGLGEDVTFSLSLIRKYGFQVFGFDPTPRAIAHAETLRCPNLTVYQLGVSDKSGTAEFYLPNDPHHVSGSLLRESHVGRECVTVRFVTITELLDLIGRDRIDLLKLDIEGAEYKLLHSVEFAALAPKISAICIEFHHRWPGIGGHATLRAVRHLRSLGFGCAWRSIASNEEFTFCVVRMNQAWSPWSDG